MEQAFLFVHFREKTTPDGEQVYFGLSRDGFHWETVNDGQPVLWAYHGDKGGRDFTVVRSNEDHKFYILATDLSLAYGMRNQYHGSWAEISSKGSKNLAIWESEDLVNWSEQRLVRMCSDEYGCVWAPDVIYDREEKDYVVHWSSSHASNGFQTKGIYYSRTRDFQSFTEAKPLYVPEGGNFIDSAMYEEDGQYYLFIKKEDKPISIRLLKGDKITGPFEEIAEFTESMNVISGGNYEAPTAVRLFDGRWSLYLDYYGEAGAAQGYVPFLADSLESGRFRRADEAFSFPYGFKHGTILPISMEEYERIRNKDWSDKGWV